MPSLPVLRGVVAVGDVDVSLVIENDAFGFEDADDINRGLRVIVGHLSRLSRPSIAHHHRHTLSTVRFLPRTGRFEPLRHPSHPRA